VVVRRHVECSPCFLRVCPVDFRCMHEVTVPEVVAAVERCLAALPPGNGDNGHTEGNGGLQTVAVT
jgi:hypothetical protein